MSCTEDTDSITLTVTAGELTADLIVAPTDGAIPNALSVGADGAVVPADGWVPLPSTLTPTGVAVGNKSFYLTSIDLTSLIAPGAKLKFTQNGSVHYFTVVLCTAGQLTLFLEDASTVDASAVTLPYFSVGASPSGQLGVGPLLVDTGDDFFALYYSAANGWATPSQPAWASANAAASTRSANTYANMTAAGYAAHQLPFRDPVGQGLTWQFRWTGGLSYGAGQTAAGVRLTAITADAAGAGGSQDTTNVFAEDLTFTANAELWHDSGWVALNASVAVKDYLVIMPQFKSDGTRTVTVSQTDALSIRARLVIA